MPKGKVTEKELMALYRARIKDRAQATTRRRKQVNGSPEPMGDLLHRYFRKEPQALGKFEEARACLAWPNFVGEAAARVSEACRVRNETLIVRVGDPLWMSQLTWLKHEVLKKYRETFPSLRLRDIYFTRR